MRFIVSTFLSIIAFSITANSIVSAAVVNLTADNAFGTSSFNTSANWSDAAAPSAGNDYFNNNFLLRTPALTNFSGTFAGNSLTITGANPIATADLNDSLMFKGLGSTGVLTVNNLTINGGGLRNGSGDADVFNLAGNLTVGANGMVVHAQGPLNILGTVAGSGEIRVVDNGSTSAVRTLHFANANNTYNGSINLVTANRSRFTLDLGANMNFVIGANGVNNKIFGGGNATLNGILNLDLSGASTTVGDTWDLIASTSQAYGSSFGLNGFNDLGAGLWENNTGYQFSTATGDLTYVGVAVPEPSTLALLGAVGAFGWARRRRS